MITSLPVKIALVYFTLYLVIPKFFLKKRYLTATVISLVSLVVFSVIQRVVDFNIYYPYFYPRGLMDDFWTLNKILKTALGIYPVVALAAFIKITKHFYSEENKSKELRQQKLEAELNFLKGQIHPHFLFNTLNNLYALTLKKSDSSPEVVLKLSELLSYMLYEGSSKTVVLSKELDLINNYIELEKLRYDDRLKVHFILEGDPSGHHVPPMLLLPFIENAFKHGTSDSIENVWVDIFIKIRNQNLELTVKNSNGFKEAQGEQDYQKGIGLKNVKRRLELLYNGYHTLNFKDTDQQYSVRLSLELDQLLTKET